MTLQEVKQHEIERENNPLAKYIVGKLVELGADFARHKDYSFNRGKNVGMTQAYQDILDKIHEGYLNLK